MDEAELIRKCLLKDKTAWSIFIDKYSRLIYWAIRKRFIISGIKFEDDDVRVIFQEVFVLILEGDKLFQLKDPKSLAAWIVMVASNRVVDYTREKIRFERRFVSDNPVFEEDTIEAELYYRDAMNQVKSVIENLSHKEKIIFSLNILENRKHKEIGRIFKMPVNTVSTIISRAKKRVREELIKRGVDY